MNLKFHFLIIVLLVVGMFVTWHWMLQKKEAEIAPSQQIATDWYIRISHASFGLNCVEKEASEEETASAYTKKPAALRQDNILALLSNLCNGKPTCSFKPTNELFSADPAPKCHDKLLEVEYRCFSYDKPWNVRVKTNELLTIDCTERK